MTAAAVPLRSPRRRRRVVLEWAADLPMTGVDEAGRGPLAGPVVAAAVILAPGVRIRGLNDSKQLAPEDRERLVPIIRQRSIACAVAWADVEEIDVHNILNASELAMRRALLGLGCRPRVLRFDGNRCPPLTGLGFECSGEAVIGGDRAVAAIAAASILAKVARDRMMVAYDRLYPGYGFAAHKGYATRAHCTAILARGVTPIHRRSFAPVQSACDRANLAGVKI
jgi:ribonuclease HII